MFHSDPLCSLLQSLHAPAPLKFIFASERLSWLLFFGELPWSYWLFFKPQQSFHHPRANLASNCQLWEPNSLTLLPERDRSFPVSSPLLRSVKHALRNFT